MHERKDESVFKTHLKLLESARARIERQVRCEPRGLEEEEQDILKDYVTKFKSTTPRTKHHYQSTKQRVIQEKKKRKKEEWYQMQLHHRTSSISSDVIREWNISFSMGSIMFSMDNVFDEL